jgi:transposase
MEDVVEVYHRPYDPDYPVVCLDEKSKELHGTPRGELAPEPGQPRKVDYEYERNGTSNLFLWVEPLTGNRKVHVTERRTAVDFAQQLQKLVDEDYPEAKKLVLVTDNLNTHSPASLYERFAPAEAHRIAQRIEWHYTPEHGSWLNMAECELSVLSRQCLNRRIPTQVHLEREVATWQRERNRRQVRIDWHFTADNARTKLRRLYPTVMVQ